MMNTLIDKAKLLALKEIDENGSPALEHFEISNKKGQELAEKFDVDKDIVMLGTILMDLKLGECIKEGKVKEHVERSTEAAAIFLDKMNVDEELSKKIINCVEAHHGTKEYICKEAEICANADCYRFIHPNGVFAYFVVLGKRFDNVTAALEQIEAKMEEKWNVLSLDFCKKELKPYYDEFKALIETARTV